MGFGACGPINLALFKEKALPIWQGFFFERE
jgi:hypothetical protein